MVIHRSVPTKTTGVSGHEKEFYADLDKAKRRPGCIGCGGCLGFSGFLLLGLLFAIVGVLAAAGFVRVPLVGSALYPGDPEPVRTVQPAPATDLPDLLASKAASITASGGTITVTEEELTGALREPSDGGEIVLKLGQLAISPTEAELYGQVTTRQTGQPVVVRVELVPNRDGTVIEAKSVKIGYVSVPLGVARFVTRLLVGIDLGTSASLAQYGVESTSFGTGSVSFSFGKGGLNLPGLGATLSLNLLQTLEKLGINPASLNTELTPERLDQLRAQYEQLTPAERESAKQAIPEIQRLDQPQEESNSTEGQGSDE